jgi:hypothetical protein
LGHVYTSDALRSGQTKSSAHTIPDYPNAALANRPARAAFVALDP